MFIQLMRTSCSIENAFPIVYTSCQIVIFNLSASQVYFFSEKK